MHLKTALRQAIQKTAETTGKIRRVSKTSPKNNSERNEEEILKERYMSPELRHKKIIYDLRLKEENYWLIW